MTRLMGPEELMTAGGETDGLPTDPAMQALVVVADGDDAGPLVAGIEALGAEAHVASRFEPAAIEATDLLVVVGSAERLVQQGWPGRLAGLPPVVFAATNASFEPVCALMNAGGRGLITLPATLDRITAGLGAVIEATENERRRRRACRVHQVAFNELTPAEHEVLEEMLRGLANKQIAQRLSIGLRTVELRRSKIMRKLGAKSLAQLIHFVCLAKHDQPIGD